MMEVGYDLFVSACTAILLAFMVAKLLSLAVCSGEVSGGVENGENRMSSEKRLKVDGLKIKKKKKVKNVSGDRVLVSELQGIAEPDVSENFGGLCKVDDGEESVSVQKDIQFLGVDVDMAYLGDEVSEIGTSGQISTAGEAGGEELSVIQKEADQIALDRRFEGLKEEIGRPIEGFDQETISAHDLDERIGHRDSEHCRKFDATGDEMLNCDFWEKEDNLNSVNNQDEHQRFSEPAETQLKEQSDEVDDRQEEIRCSVSKDKGEMEISDGEEWEGIETNELERDFAKAMNFVHCSVKEGRLDKLGSEVLMELHSLRKAAIEGESLDPQSIALNVSARAKWNAWTKSGSMNQEEAMGKYIALLSDKVPEWMDELSPEEGNNDLEEEDGECGSLDANLCKPLTLPPISTDERKTEEERVMETDRLSSANQED